MFPIAYEWWNGVELPVFGLVFYLGIMVISESLGTLGDLLRIVGMRIRSD
jgi:hypothetical protein